MAKKAKHEYDSADIVDIVTNNLNKKGRIKGKNKKETRALKEMCVHHVRKKNGKLKPMTERVGGKKYVKCTLCDAAISGQLASDEEIQALVRPFIPVVQQMKYMAAAGNQDKETLRYVTTLASTVLRSPHVYSQMRKVIEKKSHLNKKGNNQRTTNAAFGGWKNNA